MICSVIFCPGDIAGDVRIQWFHQMILFLLPYYLKWRLEAFRILLPRGHYEMSKWSHQPLELAWEWRLNLVMGIEEEYFLEVLSPSWSFSSENIPLSCIIVQNGILTTELNLSGLSLRALRIPSGRNPTLSDWNTEERLWFHVTQKKQGWASDKAWSSSDNVTKFSIRLCPSAL